MDQKIDNFVNPNVESSYMKMQAGRHLYEAILKTQAKKIIDFGVLNGYSTICMAQAAKKTGGLVFAYDLFEDYEHNNSNKNILLENLKKYNVENLVKIKKVSFYEWIKNPEEFDVLHVDVSNTGETIELLWEKFKTLKNSKVFFEGGSHERDNQDWMVKYKKLPFNRQDSRAKFKVIAKDKIDVKGRTFYPCISELLIG